jgi:hypothetical protein
VLNPRAVSVLTHRSAGGQLLQPSDVYNSITATRLALLRASQSGSAAASGRQAIADAKPTAPNVAIAPRLLWVFAVTCLPPSIQKGFSGRKVLL